MEISYADIVLNIRILHVTYNCRIATAVRSHALITPQVSEKGWT